MIAIGGTTGIEVTDQHQIQGDSMGDSMGCNQHNVMTPFLRL